MEVRGAREGIVTSSKPRKQPSAIAPHRTKVPSISANLLYLYTSGNQHEQCRANG